LYRYIITYTFALKAYGKLAAASQNYG